jgi:hypothetical protein
VALKPLVGGAVVLVFLLLGLWHVYMAAVRAPGTLDAALPRADGAPVFVPSKAATVAVGMVLFLCARLVAAAAGVILTALPPGVLTVGCWLLALGLVARAICDFRYVGLFKRVRGSRFASLDSWFYSPLCAALAAGIAYVNLACSFRSPRAPRSASHTASGSSPCTAGCSSARPSTRWRSVRAGG